jgi:drug/metabolite transporter (DMT)-like permease
MTGTLWAVVAGLGFGVFQTINRRAVDKMDVFVSTFLQLVVSVIVLGVVCLATEDVSALGRAPVGALISFGLAGVIHFSLGWTFLNASQKRIGAARTSALIGTTPLFGALLAFVTLSENLDVAVLVGIALIMAGAYLTHKPPADAGNGALRAQPFSRLRTLALAFAAPLCWSISPIFIRLGLEGLNSPLLGVTVGMTASALGYGVALGLRSVRAPLERISSEALVLKIVAGVMVGLSTWARWVALELTTVAAVLALSLVSVPTVNLLTPVVIDRRVERVTLQVWLGSALIVSGSLVLILLR